MRLSMFYKCVASTDLPHIRDSSESNGGVLACVYLRQFTLEKLARRSFGNIRDKTD
jgi:hypothetical protein